MKHRIIGLLTLAVRKDDSNDKNCQLSTTESKKGIIIEEIVIGLEVTFVVGNWWIELLSYIL